MTSHGKTSYETVTSENHYSKYRIKIAVLTSVYSHGSYVCGVISIKVVKTLVKTVSELKGVFRWFHWCDFRVFLVFVYHNKTRIKIVIFPVSWFKPLCLMSHVLVFLALHGLSAPVGWILASGALLYRLRLDQIVRFPMILELGEVWGSLRWTSSCIISVSDVSYQAHCQVVREYIPAGMVVYCD